MSDTNETYNGHPSWEAWNVALWLANDEPLYRMTMDALRAGRRGESASLYLQASLADCGLTETPDGAPYTVALLEYALEGLTDED